MKAVLILPETYERCADCDLCVLDEEEDKHFCAAPTGDWILDILKKADFCPLRPMPARYDKQDTIPDYRRGWNDCLDEIGG